MTSSKPAQLQIVSHSGRDPESVAPLVALCEMLGIAVVDSVQKAYLCFPFTHPLYQPQTTLPDAVAFVGYTQPPIV